MCIMKLDYEQREELRELIGDAVRETLIQMGISSHDPIEVQKDMQHLREWRKATESIKSKGVLVIVSVVISGIIAAFWVGFKVLLNK